MVTTVSGSVATFAGSSILPSIIYGINSTLFAMIVDRLWKNRKASEERRRSLIMSGYVFTIYALCTVHLVTDSVLEGNYVAQLVDHFLKKDIPPFPTVASDIGTVAFVIVTFMTDGLLLWRCWVLYAGCRGVIRWLTWSLFLLPSLALIAFGFMLIYIATLSEDAPLNPEWLDEFVFIAQPLSVFATNLIFAILIVGRLFHHHRRIRKLMGDHQTVQYTGMAAMVVESAAINVVFQLLSAISIFLPGPELNSIFNAYFLGQTQVLATLLIIFRVARGKAWTERTAEETKLTQLRFGGGLEAGRGRGEMEEESIFAAQPNDGGSFGVESTLPHATGEKH